MVTRVQKWGNSQGVRFSKEILEKAHISTGDVVDVRIQRGAILVQPIRQIRGRYSLRQLVSQIPKDYVPPKEEWGNPIGKETW